MTHRERVLTALRHQAPDRVPVDLGGTLASTINIHAYRRLMAHLGFGADPPVSYLSRRSNSVLPDERLLQYLDVDCRAVVLDSPDANPERELPDGTLHDEWGITWSHLGTGQHFINTAGPFCQHEPDPSLIEKFAWPDPLDPGRFRTLRRQAETLRAASDAAIILVLGVGVVHQIQFMRGYAAALEDLLAAPDFVGAFMDRYADFWVRMTERALQEVGDLVDLAMFGDDLGTQHGPVMSPALYRRLIKPCHGRMVQAVKRFDKPVLLHTCGSVAAFIPDLIEVGFDALHPIQVSARDMDSARLKREFGQDITFWGAIDTQRVLPMGTPEDVRQEVQRRIADLGPGGGYVLGAVHNVQAEVPPQNILAMVEAAREFGRYQP
ncbi:MAG TPA: uroporphyrinogen decarboxylase family protein [Candidatus Methylomirabilis sp.]|nr:uroporphyrinogen decarboxylase family protein [Candidatus Methylomirabilis sp.]